MRADAIVKLPEITIEKEKCRTPIECRKCLIVCPTAVLSLRVERVERFKETEPEGYGLYAKYRGSCSGCMDCVKICPNSAISISFPTQ